MKHILGAAVVVADILFGAAVPDVIRDLRHETHPHPYFAVGLYVVLVVATAWVVRSVARARRGGGAGMAPSGGSR